MQFRQRIWYGSVLLMAAAAGARAEGSPERWIALQDKQLIVADEHSALNFSSLVEAGPAGQYGWSIILPDGHIAFEKRRTPQRFFAASLVFSGLNGGIPDKPDADRLVQELRRTGYNLVRLHFIDLQLMTGRTKDFDFDPGQLDHLHYLLSRLKQGGIYWMADVLTSDNAAYGDVPSNRYIKKHQAKLDVLTSGAGFEHWSTLAEQLWGRKNPYTGVAPIADPAMIGLILVNEGSVGFLATTNGNRYPEALGPLFRDWLKARYGSDEALSLAWRGALKGGESLGGRIDVPESVRGNGPRDVDFARFVADLEGRTYRAMDSQVRRLGFRGLTTAFDNWGFFNADVARAAAPWIDMHSYHVLPSNHGNKGSHIDQTSIHDNSARYVRELTNARQWGKPFTVSEYGQPFWNRWRHESTVLLPAVAAHQGWDAICQFAETPIQFDYGPSPFLRRQAIYPFGIGADPILRAGERLAAMLFLRGDVQTSGGRIRLQLNPEKMLARGGGWEQVPEGMSRLGLISAVGLDVAGMPRAPASGEMAVDLSARPAWANAVEKGLAKAGMAPDGGGAKALRDAGVLRNSANRSRPEDRYFESDTGQLVVDDINKRIVVATDRTAAIALRSGEGSAGSLHVLDADGPALFALSALDDKPIRESRRLLLWVLTDAINTGMQFEDAQRTTLSAIGTFPPQVRAVKATVRFENQRAGSLRAWPLSLSGDRRSALKLPVASGNVVELPIDTAALPQGPALFFEIALP